jgi:nucleotide-binding universal stress UspA family protein
MAHVSRKLSNSFEGALAGGGDPATSPLYVFGPFLRLVVVAGVAQITFGASVWLAVFTVAVVSTMYRLVMAWVTDGSGGSGLSEEEFGGWAVKVNASITFIEYTLTFLVSMAALVTFIADRFPVLNEAVLGIQYRTFVAITLSLLTGWLVNRGPKVAARAFGPATAAVLLLLWAMVFATLWKLGFHLPTVHLAAFHPAYLNFTFGGYARILAVMTGIEVFANLVAAYDGTDEEKSSKAFGSLLIIMGTTSVTMLIVGPAIFQLSNPTNEHVSVFTQTMDRLLPAPLPYLGTLVGVAVLLSASAASAQGLQNLALGLKDRHYIPASIGRRNRFDVADKPVWIEVALVSLCFLAFGTSEETYLAIYAAGVFILLSMTGWAAAKRLLRELQSEYSTGKVVTFIGTIIAALLTSGATLIIFAERFFEGAWIYFLFIPILYAILTYFRRELGDPSPLMERLGVLEGAMWGVGAGSGQPIEVMPIAVTIGPARLDGHLVPSPGERWRAEPVAFNHVLVPLDGSAFSEQALPLAGTLCHVYDARLTLMSAVRGVTIPEGQYGLVRAGHSEQETYLSQVAARLRAKGLDVDHILTAGPVAETINMLSDEIGVDLVVTSTRGRSGIQRWLIGSVANKIVQLVSMPVLLVKPTSGRPAKAPAFKKLLVTLDGSEFAERVLPYARALARSFESEILLLSVPEVPEAQMYGAMADVVDALRVQAERETRQYLGEIAAVLRVDGLDARVLVAGSGPARTIVAVSESEEIDLTMLATHGRGGLDRLLVGSVAERVVQHTPCPVFLVPVRERRVPVESRLAESLDIAVPAS